MSNCKDASSLSALYVDTCGKNELQNLLEWELSLDSGDLRSHPWYHGSLSRQVSETILINDGDFLVRDCTSSGRAGDFVLSCRWNDRNLHFLIHRDVNQPDTIYEKLTYRFENERFDTVSDLITYHVGSGIPISIQSGALISSPKARHGPIAKSALNINRQSVRGDYVTLTEAKNPLAVPSRIEKTSTLERLRHQTLNLTPPIGLLEDLQQIPEHILKLANEKWKGAVRNSDTKASNLDLSTFSSLLLPTCEEIRLNSEVIHIVRKRLVETSDRLIALHLTKVDWEVLNSNGKCLENDGLYELVLCGKSEYHWNNIIERSFTLSQFVILTILSCESSIHPNENKQMCEDGYSNQDEVISSEEILSKWINIAEELRSSIGNFFSFSSIMRALLMPPIVRTDGKINWMKLRQKYTQSTFTFETSLRSTFQGLLRGTEAYPPNTTIPELLSIALILEDSLELLPVSCISYNGEESQLDFFKEHLENWRRLSNWKNIQSGNLNRLFQEQLQRWQMNSREQMDGGLMNMNTENYWDEVMLDIFRTEFQLLLLWGNDEYLELSIQTRSETFSELILKSLNTYN